MSGVFEIIANKLGAGIIDVGFSVKTRSGEVFQPEDFVTAISCDGQDINVSGERAGMKIDWKLKFFENTCKFSLSCDTELPVACIESLRFRYIRPGLDNWRALADGLDMYKDTGIQTLAQIRGREVKCSMLGLFPDSRSNGLFITGMIPQKHRHEITLTFDNNMAAASSVTDFPRGFTGRFQSETGWLTTEMKIGDCISAYSKHFPLQEDRGPITGFSTWDYYNVTVRQEDVIAQMDYMLSDEVFNKCRYISVDDGWQHMFGEWLPNYKFGGDMSKIADEIKKRGFIPGIWTAPVCLFKYAAHALINHHTLVKDIDGDPLQIGDIGEMYLLDPTHPDSKLFIKNLYSGLYNDGYRLFKIDYVHELLNADELYDKNKGVCEAIADLFALIRDVVGEGCHILGCGIPARCGAWLVDSGRIGIDIHTNWSHVEWVVEFLCTSYWMHKRIWVNDPDYIVVRGPETFTERTCNVLNPNANKPNPPRWRREPEFTKDEAQTWADIVWMTAGNIMLSDKLGSLTPEALDMLRKVLADPVENNSVPLDLCENAHPCFWLSQSSDRTLLLIINWDSREQEVVFNFTRYGLTTPESANPVRCVSFSLNGNSLAVTLRSHASVVFELV